MLTRTLDTLYKIAGVLAGVFLVAIACLVTAQIIARLLGMIIPSADEFAGFCLAATSFLGLAYAFRNGSHIRVTLFVHAAKGWLRQGLLILALAIASAMATVFAWHTLKMVFDNFVDNEVTSGLIPIPLWLPQFGMALGVLLFAVAIVEDLVRAILGQKPVFTSGESDPRGSDNPAADLH
ncbi:TRAP transporter small permease [Acuticoccus kandeliae]|uniref:TRAP transporter small permease n=1 Tax=Acuticoccus kandeliae TaxID=2073160 RepID=UPI000D3E538C|nr:TRAP transporter small permease [Acuticoccus kandeliae]